MGGLQVRYIYISRKWLIVLWIILGIILFLFFRAGMENADMTAAFSTPVAKR